MIKKREIQLIIIITVFCIVLTLLSPVFFTFKNIRSVLMGMTYDLVVALGMTFVLILGGLDLSVGSNLALSSVLTTILIVDLALPVSLGILMGLGVSVFIGFTNGFLISKFKINPFIVTLGMMSIVRGIARVLTSGYFVTGLPKSFLFIGQGELLGIPIPVIIGIVIALVFDYLLKNWTPLNRAFYVGANPDNAELFGIKVGHLVIVGFMLSGFFSGLSALFMSSRLAMGYAQFGEMLELRAIGAAVIGGASFKGGKGSIWGTFLGVLLLAIVRNAFVLMEIPIYWQRVVNGLVILIAIATAILYRKKY